MWTAIAAVIGDNYVITVTNPNGAVRDMTFPVNFERDVLEAGVLGVIVGDVAEEHFFAVVNALVEAGSPIASEYLD